MMDESSKGIKQFNNVHPEMYTLSTESQLIYRYLPTYLIICLPCEDFVTMGWYDAGSGYPLETGVKLLE